MNTTTLFIIWLILAILYAICPTEKKNNRLGDFIGLIIVYVVPIVLVIYDNIFFY